jgi:hypothetical protein
MKLKQLYLRWLARFIIKAIRKHFKEGYSEELAHVPTRQEYCWRWTRVFEEMAFGEFGKRREL